MKLEKFNKKLKKPAPFFGSVLTEKKGFYLECYLKGQLQRAEISSSFCKETDIDIIFEELSHFSVENFLTEHLDLKTNIWNLKVPSRYASVRAAIASLYLENIAPASPRMCFINGLLDIQDPHFRDKAQLLLDSGVQRLKLKINPQQLKVSHDICRPLMCTTSAMFRVDANQSLTLEQAVDFCKELPREKIDYFEEPLLNPLLLEEFYNKTGFYYALDENLKNPQLQKGKGLKAIVIKPALLGDFSDLSLILKNTQAPCIVSSTYETQVGLKHWILWAQFLNPNGFHGLDTFDVFEEASDLEIRNGKIGLKMEYT